MRYIEGKLKVQENYQLRIEATELGTLTRHILAEIGFRTEIFLHFFR